MNTTLTRGDDAFFRWGGCWRAGSIVSVHNIPEAIKVRQDDLEYIVTPQEIRSVGEHQQALAKERADLWKERNVWLVERYNAGSDTKNIARFLNMTEGATRKRIAKGISIGVLTKRQKPTTK